MIHESADGVTLKPGDAVWLLWGGRDHRSGLERTVHGVILHITRNGKIQVRPSKPGRDKRGNVQRAYAKGKPQILAPELGRA